MTRPGLLRSISHRAVRAAVVVGMVGLIGVSGAQAHSTTSRSATAARSPLDAFRTMRKSATSFTWTYTNNRVAGSAPVNGETIQITSSNPAILQGVTFDGVTGASTGAQSAFSFYPLDIGPGATATGTGTTNAPLPDGTTFKFFVTTDGFASTANTFSVDSTLSNPATPAGKPHLESAERRVTHAIMYEDQALRLAEGRDAVEHFAGGARSDLKDAEQQLHEATKLGELDKTTADGITSHLGPAISDDVKAENAASRQDTNSTRKWLTKAIAHKQIALRLIKAALKD